ncbi:MAG: PIN domain-containing protein [Maricaulaceae bacterium]|nr:PIN domain-containing protein [Maricaulaceae bacterium]
MTAPPFVDTNILIYAASRSPQEASKKTRAMGIIAADFTLSAQVLQEFYAVAVRKAEHRLSPRAALEWIERLAEHTCQPLDDLLVREAIRLSRRHKISYYDAAIVAAAERLGAETLYTEDLGHGQSYGPVRAVNPFL